VIVVILLTLAFVAEGMGGPFDGRRRRAPTKEEKEAVVRRKLESIVFPKVEFRQANIRDVIAFLVRASAELDPDKQGVNIILNLNVPGRRPAEREREDPFAEAAGESTSSEPWDSPVTLTARKLSLEETLKIVSQMTGLKCRVQGNAVMVVPLGAPDGEIVRRWYHVKPSIVDRLRKWKKK